MGKKRGSGSDLGDDRSVINDQKPGALVNRIVEQRDYLRAFRIEPKLVHFLQTTSALTILSDLNECRKLSDLLEKAARSSSKWTHEEIDEMSFQQRGGWSILILKIHQLLAGVLEAPSSINEEMESAAFAETNALANLMAELEEDEETANGRPPVPAASPNGTASSQSLKAHLYVSLQSGCWQQSGLLAPIEEEEDHDRVPNGTGGGDGLSVHQFRPRVLPAEWDPEKRVALVTFDLDFLWFAVCACGRFDTYAQAVMVQACRKAHDENLLKLKLPHVLLQSVEMAEVVSGHAVRIFLDCQNKHLFTHQQYEWYLTLLTTGSADAARDAVSDLKDAVWHAHYTPFRTDNTGRLERVLVSQLGSDCPEIRSLAVRMLNSLYDRHDWQMSVAFNPIIACVGDRHLVEFTIDESPENVFLQCSQPAGPRSAKHRTLTFHLPQWRRVAVKSDPSDVVVVKERWKGRVDLGVFQRCGFYDWRIVRADPKKGNWSAVRKTRKQQLRLQSSTSMHKRTARGDAPPTPPDFDDNIVKSFPVQGRFIVQRQGLEEEQLHEVFIDQHQARWEQQSGEIIARGTFASVAASLNDWKERGITTVYLMGALARDNGEAVYRPDGMVTWPRADASPFAVTCRASPCEMLGGSPGFLDLMREARRVGIKIVVDSLSRVSSSRSHRKYAPMTLSTLDESGKLVLLYGTDGRSVRYEDTTMLNYRMVESWDALVEDIREWGYRFGVDGVRLDNAQAYPQILQMDRDELYRLDPDGRPHYSPEEKARASVVVESEFGVGFWGSPAEKQGKWPNPFFVKLCNELWRDLPDFLVVGECWGGEGFEGRHKCLSRSGVVPHLQALPQTLSTLYGRHIREEGSVEEGPVAAVSELRRWFENEHEGLPYGSHLIQSSCSHSSPYPALLYGRGAWPAVDVLFFMPDIPCTIFGEMEGKSYRVDITNVFQSDSQKAYSALPAVQVRADTAAPSGGFGGFAYNKPVGRMRSARSLLNLQNQGHQGPGMQAHRGHFGSSQGQQGVPESADVRPLRHVRSMNKLEAIGALPVLEEEQERKLGPEFGYDLKMIGKHYDHRRRLRKTYRHLRRGRVVPLKVKSIDGQNIASVMAIARHCSTEAGGDPLSCPPLEEFAVVVTNFSERPIEAHVSLQTLWVEFQSADEGGVWEVTDVFEDPPTEIDAYTFNELLDSRHIFSLAPFSSACRGFRLLSSEKSKGNVVKKLYGASLKRLKRDLSLRVGGGVGASEVAIEKNFIIANVLKAIREEGSVAKFADVLHDFFVLKRVFGEDNVPDLYPLFRDSGIFGGTTPDPSLELTTTHLFAKLESIAEGDGKESTNPVVKLAREILASNTLGSVVFVTPELGKWSTVGGLGVMIDDLSATMATLGIDVWVISPYYDYNRKGQQGYLAADGIEWKFNIDLVISGQSIPIGVHQGVYNGVNLVFLHNGTFFPSVFLAVMGKAPLEVLCQLQKIPAVFVSNDWATGLCPAYAKKGHFGNVFGGTTFFHIVHNLDPSYEGRLYPHRGLDIGAMTELPLDLLVDPHWAQWCVNPSRCVLLTCDTWGTVSKSYCEDLRGRGVGQASPLAWLLNQKSEAFSYPNGIPIAARTAKLRSLPEKTHDEAKSVLQMKYFKYQSADLTVPLFAFVGRITEQKGVHLILNAAEALIHRYNHKIQILVGGMASMKDPYAARCAHQMWHLAGRYPHNFWAAPNEFFTDGMLVNMGADFGLMPSAFEPGGIVQHEFFLAGTPVIAFKTGGLKDTVIEFTPHNGEGSGFSFQSHTEGDLIFAIERALRVFGDKQKYAQLRENARAACISCEQVARAWLSEFCRLKRKMAVNLQQVAEVRSRLPSWSVSEFATSETEGKVLERLVREEEEALRLKKEEEEKARRQAALHGQRFKGAIAAGPVPSAPSGTPGAVDASFADSSLPTAAASSGAASSPMPSHSSHGALTDEVSIDLIYAPPSSAPKPRVAIATGSFDNWQVRKPMRWDNATQTFVAEMALKRGKYLYKLILDGSWCCDPNTPIETDPMGNQNNVLVVK
uniref:Starch synthase n=1 Tax=Chromera velia CCMP2878 TaxID=1169474 RepID=A0A0G4I0G9_9ALVE|eukprot:Cvel_9952.t1-p1 / transcript=Cvel_9952.t1 / gene=Cvel_9952 / organism=Chromera_velia_CCMP2878 / gene_product=Glycogen synthase, putative / transcript_product=Glycogen synthase, putative / location=Cvel_scaffold589:23168-39676(+) / protein_length=2029 / sequence_SO=supercontig / SO=protein_coding / is_pseudo=false